MEVIKEIRDMFDIIKKFKANQMKIGFVPTMGALHEGHLSLVRKSREECDVTVVSIYVNPTQFGPGEDYEKYPREVESDIEKLQRERVDVLFLPDDETMYPENYSTFVEVGGEISNIMCGISRPGHFRGVTTIVAKLFNIVQPDVAYFGQKDIQQAYIIRKMINDLNYPIELRILPIVREQDGLAMSSRNVYLKGEQRKHAVCLFNALQYAEELIKKGERDARKVQEEIAKIIERYPDTTIDYICFVDAETFKETYQLKGKIIIALAVYIGDTRLIDNKIVEV